MPSNKRPTIKQVAAEAGVSTQTISRVVNGKADVSQETRQRVQGVIDRLGYHPSAVARTLLGRRTYTLGVVGTGIEYFGPSSTLTGIEKQAAEFGFSVLLFLLHEPNTNDVGRLLDEMQSREVEGIIWAVPEISDNHRWVRELARPAVPIVFLTMQPQADLAVVSLDNRTGGRQATEHLLAQGCRNIALITGPADWWEAQQRRSGYEDALATAGLPVAPPHIVVGNWGAASGQTAFQVLRAAFPQMDGIVVSNDQMAQGVLHAAWQANVQVPRDLAIIGFDDTPEAAFTIPPLSTIRQDPARLGRVAVQVLSRLIESAESSGRIDTLQSIWLRPELVVRQSSLFRRQEVTYQISSSA